MYSLIRLKLSLDNIVLIVSIAIATLLTIAIVMLIVITHLVYITFQLLQY